jgi:hypothetical protein
MKPTNHKGWSKALLFCLGLFYLVTFVSTWRTEYENILESFTGNNNVESGRFTDLGFADE